MKETFSKIWQKIKHFSVEVLAFFTSKIFIKNFAGMIGMLLVLFFFTTTWLKCYTNHGEALHMANFEGMNLLDVKEKARKQKFDIVVDSIDLGKTPLTVIQQNPKPDALVKEERTVYLRVQQVRRDVVKIPVLDGQNESYDVYRKALKQVKLVPSSTSKVNSRVATNTVLDIIYEGKTITEEVRNGTFEEIPAGSKLTIVVSEQGYGNTRVPQLVCKTYNEAMMILENYNLNAGTIEFDQTVDLNDKNNSYVWLHDPAAGSSIRYGEQVKLRMTKNLPEECEDSLNELEAPREDTSGNNDSEENEEF